MSSYDDPVIISCSISGVLANRDQCPAIPYTPEEYAAEARRAVDEAEDPAAKKAELIAAYQKIIDVYIAAGNDMIDDVIDPRETRPTICRALEMAEGKKVERPYKKQGVVPV